MIGAAIVAVGYVLSRLSLVVLPLIVALFLAAVLGPITTRLKATGFPPALAALLTMLAALALATGVAYVIVDPISQEVEGIEDWADEARHDVLDFLDREFNVSRADVDQAIDDALQAIDDNRDVIIGGVVSGAQLLLTLIAGLILVLVVTFFLLKDGDAIWEWLRDRMPRHRRDQLTRAGEAAWSTLGSYLRGITVIALYNATTFALLMLIFGLPFVLPVALLVFFLAYMPYVGAITSVVIVSTIALFSESLVVALLVLAIATAIQQSDGNVITPIVMRRAVSLHPIVVLAALGVGVIIAGIPGALLAVPVTAVLSISLPILWRDDLEDEQAEEGNGEPDEDEEEPD